VPAFAMPGLQMAHWRLSARLHSLGNVTLLPKLYRERFNGGRSLTTFVCVR
jgi:hypothetical protein